MGVLKNGSTWGCKKGFAKADALGRHFKSEQGMQCIVPLLLEVGPKKDWNVQINQEHDLLGMAMASSGAIVCYVRRSGNFHICWRV